MFACLYSLTSPVAALVATAESFTPRFEVVGPLVMLDVSGVTRLFGVPRELGDQLRRASTGPVRIAIAPTQTAAALIALGRPGLTVIAPDEQRAVLAELPVRVLGEFERLRHRPEASGIRSQAAAVGPQTSAGALQITPPSVGGMSDALPYFHHTLSRATDAAAAPYLAAGAGRELAKQPAPSGGGWMHPRDAHAAAGARRLGRAVTAPREREHPQAAAATARTITRDLRRNRAQEAAIEALLDTVRRWGIHTFGHLAALPPGEVYERLGARGVLWQRLARGEDTSPLVPWIPEDPFEAALDLEWPIEGLEPLSFVLGRLLEPLAERLERADRGAAILHTQLRLVDKTVHARMLSLPAPMRDPKTLRTLVLLDLESHPPGAGIDRVRVLIEPTAARVTQWALFERAQPSPEQVSTLLARLTALMGDSHVGAPRLVDAWKPGAFEMTRFAPDGSRATDAPRAAVDPGTPATPGAGSAPSAPRTALRRFRLPVPARVQVQDGRPIRLSVDRRGVTGGVVVQAAGPWRTSGEWWNDGPAGRSWDRDEWDVAIADGTIYRLSVERDIGHWFLEGIVD